MKIKLSEVATWLTLAGHALRDLEALLSRDPKQIHERILMHLMYQPYQKTARRMRAEPRKKQSSHE
jgi:hypothetical protein